MVDYGVEEVDFNLSRLSDINRKAIIIALNLHTSAFLKHSVAEICGNSAIFPERIGLHNGFPARRKVGRSSTR